MSNNKYIIDKDSLTGIADAVRDKLGVGEATTDPQTGDIVYPEGKGYYIENEDVEVIAVPNGSGTANGRGTSSSPGYTEKQIIDISSSVYSQKIEKPFYQLEIEGYFYSTLNSSMLGHADFSLQTSYSDSSRIELQNDNTILQKVTKNFDSAQNRLYIRLIMVINTYNSEAYYYTRFKVLLKDENGVPIKLISSGFPYKSYTIETVPGIKKPIPYSVADIKNNIEDYWSIPEGSLNISANGTYDVITKASAIVNVPNPSTGSLSITENGTYDVTEKASAVVSVSPSLQAKTTTISQNGSQIITPDSNYDGLSAVNLTISVPNPSTGSLEITENGTYDVTDKASAVVNVPTGGGLPPFTVPTFKVYSGRSGGASRINLSSYFSTQEEMLEHLVDVALGSPGNVVNGTTGAYSAGNYGRYPICKDKYGRWISMKKLGITLPSLTYGYNSPATQWSITNAHNNDLTFCFGTMSPFSGDRWIAIVDRYILLGASDYIDYITDWYSVIVEV